MNHGREWMFGLAKKCTAEKRVCRTKKQHEAEDDLVEWRQLETFGSSR
jgi:hypothetical protein